MENKLYVTKSRLPDKENFFRRLEDVFQTAWITNHGCHVSNLEISLCDYLAVDELLLCNNGTTALMLALQCAGLAGKKNCLNAIYLRCNTFCHSLDGLHAGFC